jgi:hypothetical protein
LKTRAAQSQKGFSTSGFTQRFSIAGGALFEGQDRVHLHLIKGLKTNSTGVSDMPSERADRGYGILCCFIYPNTGLLNKPVYGHFKNVLGMEYVITGKKGNVQSDGFLGLFLY